MEKTNKTKKQIPMWLGILAKSVEWIIIFVLVGCMLVLFSQKICGETPSLFGYSIYTVVTDSMEPTYNVGDVIVSKNIKNPTKESVKKGDVIVFIAPHGFDAQGKLEGKTVTHRIIEGPFEKEDGEIYVKTKGDNPLSLEDRVDIPLDNIKGVAKGSSSFITKLVSFINKWYGFVTIIVAPLIIVLALQIRVLFKEKEQANNKIIEEEKKRQLEKIKEEQKQKEEEIKKKAIEEYLEKQKKE